MSRCKDCDQAYLQVDRAGFYKRVCPHAYECMIKGMIPGPSCPFNNQRIRPKERRGFFVEETISGPREERPIKPLSPDDIPNSEVKKGS